MRLQHAFSGVIYPAIMLSNIAVYDVKTGHDMRGP